MLAEIAPARQGLDDLMAGYQRAEPAAAELIRQVSPLLYRFLAASVGTRVHAEDLLQECWLRIHRGRHTYRPGEPVLPWLYAIARHTRADGFRRRRRIELFEIAVEQLPEPAARPVGLGESAHPPMDELLRDLPESQREVLLMLKVSGMTLEEVARATWSTVGAVKQKAHRGIRKTCGGEYDELSSDQRAAGPAVGPARRNGTARGGRAPGTV